MKLITSVLIVLCASNVCLSQTIDPTVITDAVVQQFVGAVETLPQQFQDLATNIENTVKSTLPLIQIFLPGLPPLPDIPELTQIRDAISIWLTNVVEFIKQAGANLAIPLSGIPINLPTLPASPSLDDIGKYVTGVIQAVSSFLQQAFPEIGKSLVGFPIPNIGDLLTSAISKISIWLQGPAKDLLGPLLQSLAPQLATLVQTWIGNTLSTLPASTQNAISNIISTVLPAITITR